MSKVLFQLQSNIKNLRQQLNDLIHLSYLNHQSYLCLNFDSTPLKQIPSNLRSENMKNCDERQLIQEDDLSNQIKQRHHIIETKLKNLSTIFEKRSQNHLNYLIIKQIQSQEECVRRDRLNQYEQKIYDQRRLISDKQVFTESLLRPKKQRPDNITSEQFQQIRAVQKIQEEDAKISALQEELKKLQLLRKKICQSETSNPKGASDAVIMKRQIQMYGKMKNEDLQKTKAHSLENVNLSNINNVNSDKGQKPFDEEELNNDPAITESDTKKNPDQLLLSGGQTQKVGEKSNFLACSPFELQKLIRNYQKSSSPHQVKEKYQKISSLLEKIKEKKNINKIKSKQWRQLEIENAHIRAHVKKTRQVYLHNRDILSKTVRNSAE